MTLEWAETAFVARKNKPEQSGSPRLTAIPAARSSAAVLKVRLFLVLGALIGAALAGVFAAYSYLTFTPPNVDVTQAVPRGEGLASMVAEAYLNGQWLPVPLAEEVPGLTEKPAPLPHTPAKWAGFERGAVAGRTAELHTFYFYRIDGEGTPSETKRLYEMDVLIAFTERGTPVLGAMPSFQPAIATNSGKSTLLSADRLDELTSGQKDALETWAAAWAANDSTALSAVAGAGTGYRYLGLGGFQSTGVRVLSLTPLNSSASAAQKTFSARTRVSLSSANGYETTMDMDVLLRGTGDDNVRAYVIAWGAAGDAVPSEDSIRVKE